MLQLIPCGFLQQSNNEHADKTSKGFIIKYFDGLWDSNQFGHDCRLKKID